MEENANTTFPVVVLTFEGSEDRMKALWEKNFQGIFKTVSVKPGYSILDVLAGILADNTIEKEFVLVQANTFPVAETTIDFLKLPFVYVNARGAHVFDNRLPAVLDKEMVAGYLEGVKSEADFIPEDFFKNAMEANGRRPLEASHHFGNVMLQVISASPCRYKVIEGMITKHYICAGPEGWNGIVSIVDEFLKG